MIWEPRARFNDNNQLVRGDAKERIRPISVDKLPRPKKRAKKECDRREGGCGRPQLLIDPTLHFFKLD